VFEEKRQEQNQQQQQQSATDVLAVLVEASVAEFGFFCFAS